VTTPSRASETPRVLITAGPTHEPIDAVRYLANRSSGRLGIALAAAAADRNWSVTLLLGPTPRRCDHTRVRTERFESTADLQTLLQQHAPACDVLIMAAAVADYRPLAGERGDDKLRRTGERLTLELEPTPDLLAGVAASKRPDQRFIGFALEPAKILVDTAIAKMRRKGVDAIVANPLETMESEAIEAHLLWSDGANDATPGVIEKERFADWLLDRVDPRRSASPAASSVGRG